MAIKVLPEQFTKDSQRLARFEREAKLLAQLNHPNIAAIYGFEHSDDTNFLVLELVEGETLQERVAKGPVPVEEALEVCRQIAEGVEAAHEKGVIHRDLKPANVKVTPEGKVKILDFGLAKKGVTANLMPFYSDPVLHSCFSTPKWTSGAMPALGCRHGKRDWRHRGGPGRRPQSPGRRPNDRRAGWKPVCCRVFTR